MRRFCTCFKPLVLLLLIAFPLFSAMQFVPSVQAKQGSARVYILQLYSVSTSRSWVDDPSQVAAGAIEASTPEGKYRNIPRAHPKYGQTSPFYSVSHQVIIFWDEYVNVILNEIGAIVVNTHGQILPVPTGYTPEAWVDCIAEAMTYRRLTWANMAGYPFFYVWLGGGASAPTEWGAAGFQTLMSHIGLGNVDLYPPESVLTARIVEQASQYLFSGGRGWIKLHDYADEVDLSRPLKKSDFEDCTILPLYRCPEDPEEYWEGAIIAYSRPGIRLDPGQTEGFGSFVHLGTNRTLDLSDNPTNKDHSRGYVVTAAAIWAEGLGFESYTAFNSNNLPSYPKDVSLRVAPVIAGYGWQGGTFQVRIVLGLYGALKAHVTEHAHTMDEVGIILTDIPDDCRMQARLHASKNGEATGIRLEGLWEEHDPSGYYLGLVTPSVLWILPILCPGATPFVMLANGVILYSKWFLPLDQVPHNPIEGVIAPSSSVQFYYDPLVTYTTEGDYRYEEFQSLIAIDVDVPSSGRSDWRVIPVHFWVKLFTGSEWDVEVEAGLSMAMWFDSGNNVMVFFEDFEDTMTEWSVGDDNGAAGYDSWGISSVHTAWCAQIGDNSITGTPNVEARKYDNGMAAYLARDVDLRPYQSAQLSYWIDYWIKADDHLYVEWYADGIWSDPLTDYTNGMNVAYYVLDIPTNAERIRFRFTSNNDNDVWWGAAIDNVQMTAIIPNDANQNVDAGNGFDSATLVSVSESWINYAGYLDPDRGPDLQDWYKFYAEVGESQDGRYIQVVLHSPPGSNFDAELRSPSNAYKGGPGDSLNNYVDTTGYWRIKIYIAAGFGQYSFSIRFFTPSYGPGGCPFVSPWNGTQYVVDNNLLGDSKMSGGADVHDYYKLEQTLTRKDGKYNLLISEFEHEHSYIDEVRLMAVDHESDVHVAVSPTGQILTYKNPTAPVSITDNYGNSQLNVLQSPDGNYFTGHPQDYLLLDFGNLDVSRGAKLVFRADEQFKPDKMCIHVQVLDATEGWVDIEAVRTRVYWATEIVDLSGYLPDANGELKVRLYFTGIHLLDYVGLDTSKQDDFEVHYANLVSAVHSQEGDVKTKLIASDDIYAELIPGQQIEFEFTLPQNSEEARTYIIYIEGHYYTIP